MSSVSAQAGKITNNQLPGGFEVFQVVTPSVNGDGFTVTQEIWVGGYGDGLHDLAIMILNGSKEEVEAYLDDNDIVIAKGL